ncbi:MAG: hypothetical protein AAF558_01410 [Verrucomicrobiota bacterium]
MHHEPDRLTQSWNRTDPRYSDESVIAAQMIRSAQGHKSKGKGWFGRIVCQIVFILFFFVPAWYFATIAMASEWHPSILIAVILPVLIGSAMSWFIWKF